ncbi:MAG: hypothetical protein ACOC44_10800 [Promethearchaeia archaeon]
MLSLVHDLANQNAEDIENLNITITQEDIEAINNTLNQLGIMLGDTDYDGLNDLEELYYGTSLVLMDTDCDNLNDAFEIKIGTDPLNDDTDDDGYLDGIEFMAGTDPLDPNDYPGRIDQSDDSEHDIMPPIIGVPLIAGIALMGIVIYYVRKNLWKIMRRAF